MASPIRLYGDPVLREQSRPVREFNDRLRELAEDMIEAMRAGDGIGLAAPQIGKPLRVVVLEADAVAEGVTEPRAFVNPEILEYSEESATYEEGCLSIPEVRADVVRPEEIRIRYASLAGETVEERVAGLCARVLQHEIDHLDGKLFIDRIGVVERAQLRKRLREIQRSAVKARA
jgi:peptide deformylase